MEDLYGNVESYEKRDPDMAAVIPREGSQYLFNTTRTSLYMDVCPHSGKVLIHLHTLRPCRGNESYCMATRH